MITKITTVWDNGVTFIEPKIILNYQADLTVKELCKKIKNTEFSILFKGDWSSNGFLVSNEYYIPKQEVSAASVDYLEDLSIKRKEGYNVVIHTHPGYGHSTFSSADREYINKNFPCSILYNQKGDICEAELWVPLNKSTNIIVSAEVKISLPEIEIKGIENIQEKIIMYHTKYSLNDKLTNDYREGENYFLEYNNKK